VYFGGGTPSLMNHNEIRRIFRVLSDSFLFTNDVEITFEANPSTLTDEKLHVLKESGCNRISLGIQSFRDEILRKNNCNHTVERALYVIDLILREGFVLNVDMLFGLENQTEKDLLLELNSLCSISKPLQLSLFSVRILPNTPLHEKTALTFDLEAHTENMIRLDKIAENCLLKHSFIREEVWFFYYREGSHAHVYNSAQARTIGLGASAGTSLDKGIGVNISDVNEYCDLLDQDESPNKSGSYLTEQQNYEKFVFNRILFMNRSLPDFRDIVAKRFSEHYGCELNGIYEKVVNDMLNKNYIFIKKGVIHFTKRFNKILDHFRLGAPSII
jgi:oxygen-independent coproporphyrinogen-3 oxidase